MKKLTTFKTPILFFLSLFLIFGFLSKQTPAVGAECSTPVPLDVVLVIDRSGSMGAPPLSGGQLRIYWAKAAANNLVGALTSTGGSILPHHVALVSFDDDHTVDLDLNSGTTAQVFTDKINAITANGNTYIGPALTDATTELNTHAHAGARKVVILISDGRNWGSSEEETAARRAYTISVIPALQAAADTVYSIGIGTEGNDSSNLDVPLLQQIAKPSENYIQVTEAADLPNIFQSILLPQIIICPATTTLPKTGIQGTSRSSGYDFTMLVLLTTSLTLFNLWRYRKLKIQR